MLGWYRTTSKVAAVKTAAYWVTTGPLTLSRYQVFLLKEKFQWYGRSQKAHSRISWFWFRRHYWSKCVHPLVDRATSAIGGSFLCFEACGENLREALSSCSSTWREGRGYCYWRIHKRRIWEEKSVSGAIRTDFILSAEIIVIALGTVTGTSKYPYSDSCREFDSRCDGRLV